MCNFKYPSIYKVTCNKLSQCQSSVSVNIYQSESNSSCTLTIHIKNKEECIIWFDTYLGLILTWEYSKYSIRIDTYLSQKRVVSGLIPTWEYRECCIWIDTYLPNTKSVVSGLVILTWRIQRVFIWIDTYLTNSESVYLDWYLLDEYRECCIWIDTNLRIQRVFIWIDTYLRIQRLYLASLQECLNVMKQRSMSNYSIFWVLWYIKLINIVRVQTKLCVIYIGMFRFTNMGFTNILITGKCTIKNNWDNFIF